VRRVMFKLSEHAEDERLTNLWKNVRKEMGLSEALSKTHYTARYLPSYAPELVALRRFLDARNQKSSLKGKRILHVGAGYGEFAYALRKFFKADALGVDYSDKNVDTGKRFLGPDHVRCGNVTHLMEPDESRDAVVSDNFVGVDYLKPEEEERVITEARRVLKPGGIFVVSSPIEVEYHPAFDRGWEKVFHSGVSIDERSGTFKDLLVLRKK